MDDWRILIVEELKAVNRDHAEHRDKTHSVLERMATHMNKQNVELARQEVNLKEHMRRTEVAEENISLLEKSLKENTEALKNAILPLQTRNNQLDGVFKFMGAASLLLTVIAGVLKIIQMSPLG